MLSKNEKKLLRQMLKSLLFTAKLKSSNISGLNMVELYLSFLCFEKKCISVRHYLKYSKFFNRAVQNYSFQNFTIISFKGV